MDVPEGVRSNDRGEKQEGWQKPLVPPEVTAYVAPDTHCLLPSQ